MKPLLMFVLSGLLTATAAQSAPRPTIRAVHLALSDGLKTTPRLDTLYMRTGGSLHGWLVVEARHKGKTVFYSQAPKVRKGRRIIRTTQWPTKTFGDVSLRIAKLEPVVPHQGIYDNTGKMEPYWHPEERKDHPQKWHWCPIEYTESFVSGAQKQWIQPLDTKPTAHAGHSDLGTMRYVAQLRWQNKIYWSRGKEHRDKSGLKTGISIVHVRQSDTDVGYMTELLNVPYVYGSSSPTGKLKDHQTERAVGADCADLIVYGWRRAGRKLDYTWSQGLKSHTRRTVTVQSLETGKYRSTTGKLIKFGVDIAVGDILLWNRHVAVVAAADPSGYLTPNTAILHTVMETPQLTALSKIGFGFDTPPFQVRRPRWRKSARAKRMAQR